MSGAALDARIVVHRAHGMTVRAHVRAAAGEAVALIGPSGAGKSTILQAIAGEAPLADGEVVIGERSVATARRSLPAHRRGVVLLDQHPRLFPHLTAGENVAFGLRASGVAKAAAAERADAWLDRVGLRGLGDRAPERLSGGQQQRVALARALAVEPALVLLDEPFTSLDVETAADVRALVHEQLASSGATALVVTHAAADAAALAARIVVIEHGRVAQHGALRAVLERPATRFAAAFADVNRIEGVVRDGVWTAGGGLRLDARAQASASTDGATAADGDAAAVVRPADVRLTAAGAAAARGTELGTHADAGRAGGAEFGGEATVLRVLRLPAGLRVVVALDGAAPDAPGIAADLDERTAAEPALRPGARVRVSIDPQRLRLVPHQGSPNAAPAPTVEA
ncbi:MULTISPECIES: ABC transporter ATP-binding protein [Agrococcus]|uniref:ABC transporter ATP-binding protein n=1 Tax=Agrococcus TaxID=46352 RepID=UPI00296FDFDB|nr:ABC transporter ATP-binding protein [Agrococcus baldri]